MHISDDGRKPTHILDLAFHSLDCIGPPPSPVLRACSAPAAINPNNESAWHLLNHIWRTVAREVCREYSRRLLQAKQKAVKNGLPELYRTVTAKLNISFKDTICKLIETLTTDIAAKEAMDETFDESIDRWTRSPLFIDPFSRHTLASFDISLPVGQCIKTHTDETTDKWHSTTTANGFQHANYAPHGSCIHLHRHPKNKKDRWKHCRRHQKVSELKSRDNTSKITPRAWHSTASLDSDTRSTSPEHHTPIRDLS